MTAMPEFKTIMKNMEFTQRSFAEGIGCSRTMVYFWCHGKRPSKRLLPRVCDLLGIEPEFIWPEEGKR